MAVPGAGYYPGTMMDDVGKERAVRTIANSIVVGIGKGGSCKTTLATQLAGIWSSEGKRVLLADLDTQASATKVVGLEPPEVGDGRHLMDAVMYGDDLVTVTARDNLEVVAAGRHTKTLAHHLVTSENGPDSFATPFEKLMASGRFDRIVFDLPPSGSSRLADMAMQTGQFLLVPTSAGVDNLEGLRVLAEELETLESQIVLLGVVMMKIGAGASRKRAETRDEVATILDGVADPFQTIIREAGAAYDDSRKAGLFLHEYAEWATTVSVTNQIHSGIKIPANLSDLAREFYELADEVDDRIARGQQMLEGAVS
ncbi:MAG: ParA family protein [Actinomycetota bacterium]